MAITKPSTKKKTTRVSAKKRPAYASFKRAEREEPFFSVKFTQQTLYWLILGALVVALAVWVMNLNMKVQEIYDQIEANSHLLELEETKAKKSE